MAFRELPAKLGDDRHDVAAERSRSATRRQSARILGKRFHLAVYPLKLITASPLPRGFLPKVKRTKATAWLYPPEDAQLLACPDVPLARRVLYGFLVREGLRCGEALALRWSDVDTERGAVKLDTNKTDDPRAWALAPGVAAALERFGPAGAEPGDLVFNLLNAERLADAFRIDLETAKLTRPSYSSAARRAFHSPTRLAGHLRHPGTGRGALRGMG